MLERRKHVRHHVSTVVYVGLSEAGGGILLDISEGGMGVQAVGHFAPQQLIHCGLELSGTNRTLECGSKVTWSTPSGQLGLQFLDITEESRLYLREWLLTNALAGWSPEPASAHEPASSLPAPRPPAVDAAVPVQKPVSASPAPPTSPQAATPAPPRTQEPPAKPGILLGPFPLNLHSIEFNLSSDSKGIYILGEFENRVFDVRKVGRSNDLKTELLECLEKYPHFKFAFALSEKEAWEHECRVYHQYRPRDNKFHPVRRHGTDWDCPVCGGFA